MKVVILAAGKGVRMLPLTESVPKVLIEIGGRSFIWYVIQRLKSAGFQDLIIVGGYKIEKLKEFVINNDVPAIVVEQKEQKGTAHALMQAKRFCGGEQFLVVNGDSLFSVDDLKELAKTHFTSCIVGKEVETPEKYGILLTQGNKLSKIIEKPKQFVGNLANVGLYKFTPEIWTALDKIGLSPRGEYELTDAVTRLAMHGNVLVLKLKDYWLDFGSVEDVKKVGEFLKTQNI